MMLRVGGRKIVIWDIEQCRNSTSSAFDGCGIPGSALFPSGRDTATAVVNVRLPPSADGDLCTATFALASAGNFQAEKAWNAV